jgi:hypothetical protein
MVFLFRSEFFFRTTRELEYLFFCHAKREFFFQNVTLGYMTKTLNQIIFFFLHQNQNIFLEKNHNPPFKLNGRSLKADEIQEFSTVVRPYWCHISYLDPIIMVFLCSHFNIINNQKNHVQQTK